MPTDLTQKERYDIEENAMVKASGAYHAHPSNASSCSTYQEFYDNRPCPCENGWRKIAKELDKRWNE